MLASKKIEEIIKDHKNGDATDQVFVFNFKSIILPIVMKQENLMDEMSKIIDVLIHYEENKFLYYDRAIQLLQKYNEIKRDT